MRPPEFTGGNPRVAPAAPPEGRGFNEAAGIHRRKLTSVALVNRPALPASMRPPEFTGGNTGRWRSGPTTTTGFNEAAGNSPAETPPAQAPVEPVLQSLQ